MGMDVRTTRVNTVIPNGCDFGLAEWINIILTFLLKCQSLENMKIMLSFKCN